MSFLHETVGIYTITPYLDEALDEYDYTFLRRTHYTASMSNIKKRNIYQSSNMIIETRFMYTYRYTRMCVYLRTPLLRLTQRTFFVIFISK